MSKVKSWRYTEVLQLFWPCFCIISGSIAIYSVRWCFYDNLYMGDTGLYHLRVNYITGVWLKFVPQWCSRRLHRPWTFFLATLWESGYSWDIAFPVILASLTLPAYHNQGNYWPGHYGWNERIFQDPSSLEHIVNSTLCSALGLSGGWGTYFIISYQQAMAACILHMAKYILLV